MSLSRDFSRASDSLAIREIQVEGGRRNGGSRGESVSLRAGRKRRRDDRNAREPRSERLAQPKVFGAAQSCAGHAIHRSARCRLVVVAPVTSIPTEALQSKRPMPKTRHACTRGLSLSRSLPAGSRLRLRASNVVRTKSRCFFDFFFDKLGSTRKDQTTYHLSRQSSDFDRVARDTFRLKIGRFLHFCRLGTFTERKRRSVAGRPMNGNERFVGQAGSKEDDLVRASRTSSRSSETRREKKARSGRLIAAARAGRFN